MVLPGVIRLPNNGRRRLVPPFTELLNMTNLPKSAALLPHEFTAYLKSLSPGQLAQVLNPTTIALTEELAANPEKALDTMELVIDAHTESMAESRAVISRLMAKTA